MMEKQPLAEHTIFVNAKANTGGNEDNGNSTILIGGSLAGILVLGAVEVFQK